MKLKLFIYFYSKKNYLSWNAEMDVCQAFADCVLLHGLKQEMIAQNVREL